MNEFVVLFRHDGTTERTQTHKSNDFEQRQPSAENGFNLTDCSRFRTIYKINSQVGLLSLAATLNGEKYRHILKR